MTHYDQEIIVAVLPSSTSSARAKEDNLFRVADFYNCVNEGLQQIATCVTINCALCRPYVR